MIATYQENYSKATAKYQRLTRFYNYLSFARLILVLLVLWFAYLYFQKTATQYLFGALFGVVLFLFLLARHKKIDFLRKIEKTKAEMNENERLFLEKGIYFSDNGAGFQKKSHFYAYDLDVFGEKSLFHYINRTKTFLGSAFLANSFLNPKVEEILENQESIKELAQKINWRQDFFARTAQINDSTDFHDKIAHWATQKDVVFSRFFHIFVFVFPLLLTISVVLGYGFDNEPFRVWAILIFMVNLGVFIYMLNAIHRDKSSFEGTYKILYSYQKSIDFVEKSRFDSEKLNQIQQKLLKNDVNASILIKKLANLLDDLDNMSNFVASIPLNCFTFYHFYVYLRLICWKKQYANDIFDWLGVISQMETLGSFANFAANHPQYAFPTLNADCKVDFENLGHPLISERERVVNSISFSEKRFVILTGSNMSGKSTFLRALGVNMLLTLMGLPVCAEKANVHPMRILVSMRLSDSLTDGNSYFFAEIQRIHEIMQIAEKEPCFVLLDELLRGTNSEDKQIGTVKIIEKMLALGAVGIVATHDVQVCKLIEKYPQTLANNYFAGIIENDQLRFDYKIREGICCNRNATFLMKKLNIID